MLLTVFAMPVIITETQMFGTRFAIAALTTTAMLVSTAAFAQSTYPQPPTQLYSQSSTLAQAGQQPANQSQCGQEAERAEGNAVLHVQQTAPWAEERASVLADLQTASAAAATGDEAMCQFWLRRARTY